METFHNPVVVVGCGFKPLPHHKWDSTDGPYDSIKESKNNKGNQWDVATSNNMLNKILEMGIKKS